VTISHDQGDVVQIGSGISAADRIALNISDQIASGDKVNAIDNSQPAAPATVEKSDPAAATIASEH
jgi:hypothetical protein